jgi:hypothetical protein
MASLFERSTRIRHKRLAKANGKPITLRRGNDSTDGVVAVPAKSRHDDYGDETATLDGEEQDWLIWVTDYAFGGVITEPQRNDRIDWTDAEGNLHTYEVLERAGETCSRHTDQTKQQYRVFTIEKIPSSE